MKREKKPILVFLASWLFVIPSVCPRMMNTIDATLVVKAGTNQMRRTSQCIPDADLTKNLITLRLNLSGEDLFNAKSLFLSHAKKSSECRGQVVRSLMTAMDQPAPSNGLGGVDRETYALWRNGADLLGELRDRGSRSHDCKFRRYGWVIDLIGSLPRNRRCHQNGRAHNP